VHKFIRTVLFSNIFNAFSWLAANTHFFPMLSLLLSVLTKHTLAELNVVQS
jgi:hypothetical protein